MGLSFILTSALLGVGLAMDAFSVSLANGLNEPDMKASRMLLIAGVFGGFQFLMPVVGWVCVHTVVQYFTAFELVVPWIAFLLLAFIGGKMILEGVRDSGTEDEKPGVGMRALLLQGVATSIDALSVGFTIASYSLLPALVASGIIGVVTIVICVGGLGLGRIFGTKLAGKASIFGGVILLAIGIKILVESFL